MFIDMAQKLTNLKAPDGNAFPLYPLVRNHPAGRCPPSRSRELGEAGVKVPNGFALTAGMYTDALSSAKAWAGLHALLDNLDITDVALVAERAAKARQIVYTATGNAKLHTDIEAAYRHLETQYGTKVALAVRSSATAEGSADSELCRSARKLSQYSRH